jgi:hypothetical protein
MRATSTVPTVQQELATTLWLRALEARGAQVSFTKSELTSIGYLLRWTRFDAQA